MFDIKGCQSVGHFPRYKFLTIIGEQRYHGAKCRRHFLDQYRTNGITTVIKCKYKQ